jgi:excisionase family DNA binding protein
MPCHEQPLFGTERPLKQLRQLAPAWHATIAGTQPRSIGRVGRGVLLPEHLLQQPLARALSNFVGHDCGSIDSDREGPSSRLSIGRTKVYELMASGELPVVPVGRLRRVPRDGLLAWIAKNTRPTIN